MLDNASSYTGAVSLATNGTGNATLTGVTSALDLGTVTVGGNLVASAAGALTDSGVLTVTGTSSFATTAGNAAITLNYPNAFTGAVSHLTNGTGNATLTGVTTALDLGTSTIGGNAVVSSAGAITDSGQVTVTGTSSFTTTAGNAAITLDFPAALTGAVTLAPNGRGKARLVGNTATDLAGTTIGGNLSVSSAGAITDAGALTVTGTSSFTTTAGNAAITLDNASGYTGTVRLATNGTGNATLTGVTTALDLGTSTIGGNAVVSSAGAITDSGQVTVTGTSSFTTTAGNAAITLDFPAALTGTVTLAPNGTGNATLVNNTARERTRLKSSRKVISYSAFSFTKNNAVTVTWT